MEKAVVMLSGGVDSSTVLYSAVERYKQENVLALIFDYGRLRLENEQYPKEVISAIEIASAAGVRQLYQVISLPKCPLTTGPEEIPEQKEGKQRSTVVPGRNTVLLSFGLAYAESIANYTGERVTVEYGACAEDDVSYPDCRPSYIEAMRKVYEESSEGRVLLDAPFAETWKKDIVAEGVRLGVPYEKTYTCYRGDIPSCGVCDACVERIASFKANGLKDPMSYKTPIDWAEALLNK
jgi:7-cyano-7-deazaguanine synthase